MRKIIVNTFITLDGVMQAPGGPEEDPTGGFEYGGWSVNYWDEMMAKVIMDEMMAKPFDLLLGRRTYEIFAAHWPFITNDPIAEKFNNTTKYVVSHQKAKLTWQNSVSVYGNIPAEIKKIRNEQGNDLLIQGSSVLLQTLLFK